MVMTEPASPLDAAALDRLRKLGGDPLVARMIDLFMENSVRRMDAAREGVRDRDLRAVAQAVHSLKSSAANLGANDLRHIAEEIEIRADGQDAESVVARLPALEAAFAAAHAHLVRERGSLSA